MARVIVENAAVPGKSLPPPTDVSWGAPLAALPSVLAAASWRGPGLSASTAIKIQVVGSSRVLYAFVQNQDKSGANRLTLAWRPAYLDEGNLGPFSQAMTKIAEIAPGDVNGVWHSVWRLVNPNPSTTGTSCVRMTDPQNLITIGGALVIADANLVTPNAAVVLAGPSTGQVATVTVPNVLGLVINAAGGNAAGVTGPTPGGGQVQRFALVYSTLALGGGSGAPTPTWNFGKSCRWRASALDVLPA